jgi:diguanylate cyclase (GGDEF)-like protein
MTRLVWAAALAIAGYSLLRGYPPWHAALDAGAVAAAALVAGRPQLGQRARSLACSFGLLTAAAMAVHVSGGVTEAHFSFFVVIVLLTLYEDWTVFALAVVYTLLHHGVLGTIAPGDVYAHGGSPWGWAAIHALFVAAAGAAGVVAWRLNEDVRQRMRETQEELRNAATTDSLTGLPNRRQLMLDLEGAVNEEQTLLALFDLNGFKTYNDVFGHLAGDALLTRLGHALRRDVESAGKAYRLGGDEFCVLASGPASEATVTAGVEALSERGGAFTIGNSHGVVRLDDDTVRKPEDALRIADQRMYEHKNGGRRSAGDQSKAVLLRAMSERHPDLTAHSADVSRTAELVARRLDISEDRLEPLCHAAELHDVGKVGIPDAILSKPGPLDDEEWSFIRRHTVIGERIVGGAPALAKVGRLVRSSHERWDGKGYPDELRGDAIPLGSRIIAVCDAFDAMISDRPYQTGQNANAALAELRRCSGTQFDPAVVDAFCEAISEELEGPQRVAGALPG